MRDWQTEINFIRVGKKDAYTPIIETYENEFFQMLSSLQVPIERSEEVVVETFVHLYNELSKQQETKPIHEWIIYTSLDYMLEKVNTITIHKADTDKLASSLQNLSIEQKKLVFLDVLFNITGDEANEIKWKIIQPTQHGSLKPDCLSNETLFTYNMQNGPKEFVTDVEDHLEFCPDCRQTINKMNHQLKKLSQYIKAETLEHSLAEKILPKLKRQKTKFSFLKQLVVAITIITLFSSIIYIMPNVDRWSTLASNYIKYGDFYNVWAEGTHVATDKDISIELLSIDLSDTLTKIDFRIRSDREFIETYDNFGEHLLTSKAHGMFTIKIGEETYPLHDAAIVTTSEDLLEGSFYINMNEIEQKLLQDNMTLAFRVVRIGGVFGDWNVEIPLEYTNGLKQADTFVEGKELNLFNTFVVHIDKFSQNDLGSDLEFKIVFNEEEQGKFDRMNDLYANKFNMDYQAFYFNYSVITENGERLLQFPYNYLYNISYDYYNYPNESDTMKMQTFTPYILTNYDEQEVPTIKRRLDEGEALYFQVDEINYNQIVDEEIEFVLEEVNEKPLNIEIDDTVLEHLTIRKLEATEHFSEGLLIYITGFHKDENVEKRFSWYFADNYYEGYHSGFYGDDHMSRYNQLQEELSKDTILFTILPAPTAPNQKVTYKVDFISHTYKPGPQHRIPLNKH
ncbi:hypothetical protein [Bacillus sp. FJAT-45066]|uniref:hypothetical protein n=1 Tax=Bacillus sp. FJAT-45066 TaxID=2011010 RepID=UPI000BB837C2|nr:hypothetical protein [Bacillus sp. FJAT-45066]